MLNQIKIIMDLKYFKIKQLELLNIIIQKQLLELILNQVMKIN